MRDPDAALDLLLESLGRSRDELLGLLIEQQNRDRVDVERLLGSVQELIEEAVEGQLGQRRIAESVGGADLIGRTSMIGSAASSAICPGPSLGRWVRVAGVSATG